MNSIFTPAELSRRGFRLQFITNGSSAEQHLKGAEAALRGGCRWVQLRMKDAIPEEIVETGRKLRCLADLHGHATFILDDHAELVAETGADGVHLGKNDMSPEEARKILGPEKIIGSTANCLDDIRLAARRGADYIGLGPFRFTTTKKNLSPVLGLEGYRSILAGCSREGITLPVVAIGGITLSDILAIIATGAAGVAVSGAILNAISPESETGRWIQRLENPTTTYI